MAMKWLFLAGLASLVALSGARAEMPIAEGCARPESAGRVFHIDPRRGSMSNDGSTERPWRALSEVLDERSQLLFTRVGLRARDRSLVQLNLKSPAGPIRPGDVLELHSGEHGNVVISGALNEKFITVRAAKDQDPVLNSLTVSAGAKWVFEGLTIRGSAEPGSASRKGPALVAIGGSDDWLGPTSDIILYRNRIITTEHSRNWRPADWITIPFGTGLASRGSCVTVAANHLYNLRNAISVSGPKSLVAGNVIERIGNDGIQFSTGDIAIRDNLIRDGRNSTTETQHADGIQGWAVGGATNRNVRITGNIIIKTGNPLDSYMQGISIFDGKWNGMVVANNVVVTNHWHGIALFGVQNTVVTNNTVVSSSPALPKKFNSWIMVRRAKDGVMPTNVVIRNNIADQLIFEGNEVTFENNVAVTAIQRQGTSQKTPGNYSGSNVIDERAYSYLTMIDHDAGRYDLRPLNGSRLVGAGAKAGAEPYDITGLIREGAIDIGAYSARGPSHLLQLRQ